VARRQRKSGQQDDVYQRLTPAELAAKCAASSDAGEPVVTEQQIRAIAERGGLLDSAGTLDLAEYTAFLIQELHGPAKRKD